MSLRMPRVQVRMAPIFKKQAQPCQSSGRRESDVEGRAVAGLALHSNRPVMLQDNAPRDRQAQASAVGLGGEEGLEQARQVARRNAGAVILYRYPDAGPAGRNNLRDDRKRAILAQRF